MHVPPVTRMAKWRPNHWITESGYALNELDVSLGNQRNIAHAVRMMNAAKTATDIIREVMAK